MNRKMILLMALIAASPVLQVAASAESMYKNLVESVILSNPANKWGKLVQVRDALASEKRTLQDEMVSYNVKRSPNAMDSFFIAALGVWGTVFGASACHLHYTLLPTHTGDRLAVHSTVSGMAFGALICLLTFNYIQIKLCAKKIREIDAVLVKFDALETAWLKEAQQSTVVEVQ